MNNDNISTYGTVEASCTSSSVYTTKRLHPQHSLPLHHRHLHKDFKHSCQGMAIVMLADSTSSIESIAILLYYSSSKENIEVKSFGVGCILV